MVLVNFNLSIQFHYFLLKAFNNLLLFFLYFQKLFILRAHTLPPFLGLFFFFALFASFLILFVTLLRIIFRFLNLGYHLKAPITISLRFCCLQLFFGDGIIKGFRGFSGFIDTNISAFLVMTFDKLLLFLQVSSFTGRWLVVMVALSR